LRFAAGRSRATFVINRWLHMRMIRQSESRSGSEMIRLCVRMMGSGFAHQRLAAATNFRLAGDTSFDNR
jgi:hypothetical protein